MRGSSPMASFGWARPVTSTKTPRLLAWYRVVPLLCMLSFGAIALVYSMAPAPLLRLFYPLSHEELIVDSATRHGVDPYLVAAVIETESGWDESAESNRGAQGLMQLMPETARDMVDLGLVDDSYDASNLGDPATNIEFGCAYLSYLISYFNGSIDKAVAAYNAGMGNVEQWAQRETALQDAIEFPETQAYLARVSNARERYQALYPHSF